MIGLKLDNQKKLTFKLDKIKKTPCIIGHTRVVFPS